MERAESLKVGRSLGKFAGQIARSTLWKEKILLSIIAVLWGAIVLQKFITHPPSSCAHITKSDTMQIFRSMMWLCVHGLWDSYWFQPNTEASLTTAVTTIAVALHILKCTLCKITFSTLNGSAVIFPEVCVLDICFCDTLDIWLTGFIIKIFEITRLRRMQQRKL